MKYLEFAILASALLVLAPSTGSAATGFRLFESNGQLLGWGTVRNRRWFTWIIPAAAPTFLVGPRDIPASYNMSWVPTASEVAAAPCGAEVSGVLFHLLKIKGYGVFTCN